MRRVVQIYMPQGAGVWYGRVSTHEVASIVHTTILGDGYYLLCYAGASTSHDQILRGLMIGSSCFRLYSLQLFNTLLYPTYLTVLMYT